MGNQFEVIETQRKRHPVLKWVILGILIFLAIGAYILLSQFKVKEIEIAGNKHYTKEEMIDLVKGEGYVNNTVILYMKNKMQGKSKSSIPFVDSYDIEYKNRNTVLVTIYEKAMAGCIEYMGEYIYFDKDGIVLETATKKFEDVPVVKGFTFDSIVLHEKLPAEDDKKFETVLDLTQQIKKNNVNIDKIRYSVDGELVLYYRDVKILFGKGGNIDEKVAGLADILATKEIQDMAGSLEMQDYTSDSPTVTFKKAEK